MTPKLPPDFEVWETHYNGQVIVLELAEYRGLVSIDIKKRCFELGGSSVVRWVRYAKQYTGRGWKQALFDDAMAHLRDIYKDSK